MQIWIVFLVSCVALTHACILNVDCSVRDTSFSVTRGFFSGGAFDVVVSTLTPDAEIQYTLDGSDPFDSTTFFKAKSPATISINPKSNYAGKRKLLTPLVLLRAAAVKKGYISSNVDTQSYIFPSRVKNQDNSFRPSGDFVYWTTAMDERVTSKHGTNAMLEALQDIPSLSIVNKWEHIFGEEGILRGNNLGWEGSESEIGSKNHPDWVEERECSVELIYPDNERWVNMDGGFQVNAGLKIQGGGSRKHDGADVQKQSLSLRFRSEYGAGKLKYPIFESAPNFADHAAKEFDKLILRAGNNKNWASVWDPEHTVYTRDQLGRDMQIMSSDIGGHGTFVHLYLNGIYYGLYNIVERQDNDFSSSYLPGNADEWSSGKVKGGLIDGTNDALDYFQNDVAKRINMPVSDLSKYIDLTTYFDILLINIYAATGDFPQFYYGNRHIPENGPLYFFNWDLEDAFGGGSKRTSANPNPEAITSAVWGFRNLYKDNADFRDAFINRAYKLMFNNGALVDGNVKALWNNLNNFISKAILAESARWGGARGDNLYTINTWNAAKNAVTNDLTGRKERMKNALLDFNLHGYSLYSKIEPPMVQAGSKKIFGTSYSAKSGYDMKLVPTAKHLTMYYTLDGTDPRAPGGSIYSKAKSSSAIVTINNIEVVKTVNMRQRSKAGLWSPLRTMVFAVNQPIGALDVTEVMYNPLSPTADEKALGYSDESFEFVELHNPTKEVVHLSGARIKGDINMNFGNTKVQPGEYVVVVHTKAAFIRRYGGGPRVVGEYGPYKMSNTGGRVKIMTAVETEWIVFDYNDGAQWPKDADGNGYSLERQHKSPPAGFPKTAEHWRLSTCVQGSPGEANPTNTNACPKPIDYTLAITEVMYNPKGVTQIDLDAGYDDEDIFEFLELTNTGDVALNLDGVALVQGVSFSFGTFFLLPGARTLIVRDTAAFLHRHGVGYIEAIGGQWGNNKLSNSGEAIVLSGPSGEEIFSVTYSDIGSWPSGADGLGYSLVPKSEPIESGSTGTKWRESTCLGGSPGLKDTSGMNCKKVAPPTTSCSGATVVVDNTNKQKATTNGFWVLQNAAGVGQSSLQDKGLGKGNKNVAYKLSLSSAGIYEVFVSHAVTRTCSPDVRVEISHAHGISIRFVNQCLQPTSGAYTSLGLFQLQKIAYVTISNQGTTKTVMADAVKAVSCDVGLPPSRTTVPPVVTTPSVFGQTCKKGKWTTGPNTGKNCNCKISNCGTCQKAGGKAVCTICTNKRYLYSGKCVFKCPSGTTKKGKGISGRKCL